MRVAVIGAGGRMGVEACRAIDAADGLELVAAVGRSDAGRTLAEVADLTTARGEIVVASDLDAVIDADVEVAVELTGPATVGTHLVRLLEEDIHAVVGATGWSTEQLERARELASDGQANALLAPNFAIGAVLLMRFAAEAARHLPHVEVIEQHHDRKLDAPSGTALRTAELIDEARRSRPEVPLGDEQYPGARGAEHAGVRVHSVRLPGLVAHQEVVFGGEGQTLTLRHDTIDRSSFMPGIVLACRRVPDLDGLVIGLEHVL
ncbi:MAG: 4-hydroxy-tetrahydrodipicolinate reductase [Nitriliruptoraceae bacterium]|nr:4-hydroxy-tetrahydrodipicolinate reductase [Nitriliruptoraceae bacterium]